MPLPVCVSGAQISLQTTPSLEYMGSLLFDLTLTSASRIRCSRHKNANLNIPGVQVIVARRGGVLCPAHFRHSGKCSSQRSANTGISCYKYFAAFMDPLIGPGLADRRSPCRRRVLMNSLSPRDGVQLYAAIPQISYVLPKH